MIVTANARLVISVKAHKNMQTGQINLTSVVLPICFQDTLTIDTLRPNFMDIVHYANLSLHISEKQIVDNALAKMREKYKYEHNYGVKIYKNIPTGHGLGSGASNAMAVIKAIIKSEKLHITSEELYSLAKEVGQDVPFFAINKPSFYDHAQQKVIPINFNFNPHVLLIIHPNTLEKKNIVETFADIGEMSNKDIESVINAAESGSYKELGAQLFNDFSEIIIKDNPEIKNILLDLKKEGIEVIGIGGTSTTIFSLSDNRNLLKYIADKYRKRGYETIITRICK